MNKNLGLLLSGQLVSQMGDKFHMLAVAYWALKTTGSPAKMGIVLFASIFPAMLLSLISGAFLDSFNRKVIIVGADLLRGLIVAALCVAYHFNALSFPLLIAAQFSISVCTAFFDPAIPTIIPQIVKRGQLTRANAQTQFIGGLAMIAGPVLGGILVAWTGYLVVFFLNAVSYLFSAFLELFIRLPMLEKPITGKQTLLDNIISGYRYIYGKKHLMVILTMVGVIHFFVGTIEAVIPVLAADLKGDGAQNIGYIQSAFGIGLVLAALIISIRTIDGKEIRLLFGSILMIGILLVIISGVHMSGIRAAGPFLFFFIATGGAVIFASTSFRSILQKEADEHMMGRVFGFASCVGNISIPLSILVAGYLLEHMSPSAVLAASGCTLIPISLNAYSRFVRSSNRNVNLGRFDIDRSKQA